MSGYSEGPRIRDPSAPATDAQRELLTRLGDPGADDPALTKGEASARIDLRKLNAESGMQPARRSEAITPATGSAARELAAEPEETPGFVTGTRTIEAFLVEPVVDLKRAIQAWTTAREFRNYVLSDEECFDVIEGSKEMNRTGATRLAFAFALSLEERSFEMTEFMNDKNEHDARFVVRVRVGRGQRFADGVGSARLSEIAAMTKEKGRPGQPDYRPAKEVPVGQREHFAYTRAFTRAHKRAIADLLGGTEAE